MRRSTGVTAALVFGLVLAGCGGGSETSDDTPETADNDAAEETPEESGGSLTIWVDETRSTALASTVEEFEEDTGATVELVEKNFDDIRPDFLAQAPTGEGPDLTVGAHDWLGELTANGVVEPVELGDLADDLTEAAVSAFTYDGQIYGMPYSVENPALIRNDDIVDETPDTWDELLDQVEALDVEYPFLIQVDEEGDRIRCIRSRPRLARQYLSKTLMVRTPRSSHWAAMRGWNSRTSYATWVSAASSIRPLHMTSRSKRFPMGNPPTLLVAPG